MFEFQRVKCVKLVRLSVYLILCVLVHENATQKTYPSKVSYAANKLYEMRLDMEPTSVQLILDPRRSSGVTRLYDLAFMASQPRSEIRRIPDATARVNTPEQMAKQFTVTDYTTIKTPNSVGVLPENTIDSQPRYVWWVASGRFGSGSDLASNNGGIFLIDLSSDKWEPQAIYEEAQTGFTHVEWMDMDLDGKKDCITIKGRLNRAYLMWLSQPRSGSAQWVSHPISNSSIDVGGTDFKLMKVQMPKGLGTRYLIIVAGRRTARLTGYWVDDADNDWTQTSNIQSSLIDSSKAFVNVEIVDLNGDGADDILTSVSAFGGNPGHVLAYEVPKSGLGSGEWRKRVLHIMLPSYSNYRTLTPGPSYPFFVSSQFKQEEYKPHILVSGADDGKVYVLSPDSWSPFIWEYSMEEIYVGKPSVGVPAVHDVDGDGNAEIFIPAGESVYVMRYQPSNASTAFRPVFLQTIISTVLSLGICFLWSKI